MTKVGRPLKYSSDEERKAEYARKAREKYAQRKQVSVRDYVKIDNPEYHRGKPWYAMWHNAKTRAKKNNIPFNITVVEVMELYRDTKICPLLGIEFTGTTGRSLDKIIPELGYIKGNIQILSRRANAIKNDASFEEFERIYFNWKSLNSNHNS